MPGLVSAVPIPSWLDWRCASHARRSSQRSGEIFRRLLCQDLPTCWRIMVTAFSFGVVLAFVVAQRAILVDCTADVSDCRIQIVNLLDAQCLHRLDCNCVLRLDVIARVGRPGNVRIEILFGHERRHGCVPEIIAMSHQKVQHARQHK